MKKIKVFNGAAIMYDDDLEKMGISFSTNTGEAIQEMKATGPNIKKYLKDKKYPEYKPDK